MALSTGSRLGPYEILAPLGAGGMGEVYRARDTKLDREVAIKVLPPATASDPAALARFEREAKAVAALSHPNILAIHDFGSSNGVTYAVTELLHGETLRQRLDHGPLPQRRAAEIAREIALGLAAAHEKGIVHRDLKPENLFLTRDGRVKILDFGLARQVSDSRPGVDNTLTDPSQSGVAVGTAGYMSPEQVRGGKADHRSDIFSFGAVLYEMLSGKRAFRGETSVDTMSAILTKDPPLLSESSRQISPSLERIVTHCLEKQPSDRFQSTRDLAFDLGSLSATSASGAAPAMTDKSPWRRRAALAAAAIIIAAIGAWAGDRHGSGERTTASPMFRRLTFRRGNLLSARFAPDGKTVVYAAAWEGKPAELFSVRTDSLESRPLGIERADILSISARAELAILFKKARLFNAGEVGTLARIPFGGGAARELLENVFDASWAPNGEDLAVLREVENGLVRLEFPIGHKLYDALRLRGPLAVSPDGNLVAFAERVESGGTRTTLCVIDRSGKKQSVLRLARHPSGLAWSSDSRTVFFVGGAARESQALRAVDLAGRERVVLPAIGAGLFLHDVSHDGRFLLERSTRRMGLACRPSGEAQERELAWLDGSDIRGLSSDGWTMLFREGGDGGAGSDGGAHMRRCDGSPAIRLGDGEPDDLSPDGKFVLAHAGSPPGLVLLPTGSGLPRMVQIPGSEPGGARFRSDGREIAVWQEDEGGEFMAFVGLDGGQTRKARVPDIADNGSALSPNGSEVAYVRSDGKIVVSTASAGAPRELPGPPLNDSEGLKKWSGDGRFLYIFWIKGMPAKILRREIATGTTVPWLELQPGDPTGVTGIRNIQITPDGRSYAYSYMRTESCDLFVAEGLK